MKLTNFLFAALVSFLLSGCLDKKEDEKKAAISGKPVMAAEYAASTYCSGNFTVTKPLTEACKVERDKFGASFKEGANCVELDKAMSLIEEIRRKNAGSCSPKIRF